MFNPFYFTAVKPGWNNEAIQVFNRCSKSMLEIRWQKTTLNQDLFGQDAPESKEKKESDWPQSQERKRRGGGNGLRLESPRTEKSREK